MEHSLPEEWIYLRAGKTRRGSRERFPEWENPPRLAGAFPGMGKPAAARGNVSRNGKARRGSRERFPEWESPPRLAGAFPGMGKPAAACGNVSRNGKTRRGLRERFPGPEGFVFCNE
ncbi:MAG TPA: hypothetical protein H9848_04715 [Candidatus Parabacteroides intestinigallinarum]|uniref:Uncharacterized protein n=1 Tax=Candidatus Parabacteroides intestinigallinarum TaxID=2838722 RepID=A0A9D1XTS1_9BACT|nr:hypothetical protein [Candidatus Parabacteroides intestinigallinarum]